MAHESGYGERFLGDLNDGLDFNFRLPIRTLSVVPDAYFTQERTEKIQVDRDVLAFLTLSVPDAEPTIENPPDETSGANDCATLFKSNVPPPIQMRPVLGRSSSIDGIAHGAPTWDQLYEDLNALLYRLRHWNISVRLPKSKPYLSHEICAEGIGATPMIAKSVQDLPF
ncbi:LOW QUALITY PROTEIN: hypothetical protein PHMEG_00037829 [Phytophthora megakarya]|uniref:Reverse transcriptase n=1 Tax=Phytophthora megakarya TaxID=4795 RepID=A0A225UIY1_9STRA|nr:LOW QUALITY PROTEIN: hypothetical protein PHMEG_00037829 [Phytophthora megakarya]